LKTSGETKGRRDKTNRGGWKRDRKKLNKRKIREVVKYLVWWKKFIAEHDI